MSRPWPSIFRIVYPILILAGAAACGRPPTPPYRPLPAPLYAGDFTAQGRLRLADWTGGVLVQRRGGDLAVAVLADGGVTLASVRLRGGELEANGEVVLGERLGRLARTLARAWFPTATDGGVTWGGDPGLPRRVTWSGGELRPGDYRVVAGTLLAHRFDLVGRIDGWLVLDIKLPSSP